MDTQTGNDTWFVLFQQMKKIKKDLKKKDKSDALGRLFGVLLFATEDDTWLADNEVGMNSIIGVQTTIGHHLGIPQMYEEKEFLTWFPDYSQAWKKVSKRLIRTLALPWREEKTGVTGPFSMFLKLENLDWLKSKSPKIFFCSGALF